MYLRKIIQIKAEDSPNVRYARAQQAAGIDPTGEDVLPGVLSWGEYQKRRRMWDSVRQLIGLDAEFPEDASTLWFPPHWLNRAEDLHRLISRLGILRQAKAIGIDPAEGGDKSSWTVVDRLGVLHQVALRTPDTSVIPARTRAYIQEYKVLPDRVMFDRGGGGYEHACQLRLDGLDVQTVGFGETLMDPERYKRFHNNLKNNALRREELEERYVYLNRRAEMYGMVRDLLNPALLPENLRDVGGNEEAITNAIRKGDHVGFAIPPELTELRRQLAPMPLNYDKEGRMYMLSKNKKDKDSKERTLIDLIGCSPDEADSLALAVFAMMSKPLKRVLKAH